MTPASASDWPSAERLLRERYETDNSGMPRRSVKWRLYDVPTISAPRSTPSTIALGLRRLFGKQANADPVIAVWPHAALTGAPADLLFEFEPWPSARCGDAVLVGDPSPNGALCLELSNGEVVWPTYNPRRPSGWMPRL